MKRRPLRRRCRRRRSAPWRRGRREPRARPRAGAARRRRRRPAGRRCRRPPRGPGSGEGKRRSLRVDVGAREMTGGIDHHHDHEPEAERDPDRPKAPPWTLSATIAPHPQKGEVRCPRPARAWRGRVKRLPAARAGCRPAPICRDPATVSRSLPEGPRAPSPRSACRVDRAGVAAAHRDHDVRGPNRLVRERLRKLLGDVGAELGHSLDHHWVDLIGRIAAGRADLDPPLRRVDECRAIWLRPRCGRRRRGPRGRRCRPRLPSGAILLHR